MINETISRLETALGAEGLARLVDEAEANPQLTPVEHAQEVIDLHHLAEYIADEAESNYFHELCDDGDSYLAAALTYLLGCGIMARERQRSYVV